ncbi:MAG: shikimate dehydrogenase, partial [Micromonospora sp.]
MRAAVVGKPIGHSLSPVIHNAGYAAAGLTGWSYTWFECAAHELAGLVAGLGPEWAGLSVTMPGKEAALAVADEVSPVAAAVGAANTLVRRPDGSWYADNTDVSGMVDVLTAAGVARGATVTVLG